MPMYETIFIVQPDLPEAEADTLSETFKQVVTDGKGELARADGWGKRKLAYVVKKHAEGYFFYLRYEADASVVTELERRLRNSEQVLKYLSVKLDRRATSALDAAEKKAAEKAAIKAQREAERAARQQEEVAAAEQASAAEPTAPAKPDGESAPVKADGEPAPAEAS